MRGGRAGVYVEGRVSATLLDVEAVRARFSALDRRLAFFDGPGGTQCPDEVIDAIAALPARVERECRRAVRDISPDGCAGRRRARACGARSSAAIPARSRSGQSMTALNFLLTRALARELRGRRRGARHAARPRRERRAVARARRGHRHRRPLRRRRTTTCSLDLDDLGRQAHAADARRRVPGRGELGRHRCPTSAGSSSSRTRPARSRGSTPCTTGRTGRSTSPALGLRRARLLAVQVLRPAHGARLRPGGAAAQLAAVQGAARGRRAGRAPLRARHVPARAARGLRRRGRLRALARLGRDHARTSARSASGSSTACPTDVDLHGLPTMEGRVPTFCFSVPGRTAQSVAEHLAEREVAVWWGNYYALETMRAARARRGGRRRARRASSTTTRPRRSTGCSPASRSWRRREAPAPRRPEVRRAAR